ELTETASMDDPDKTLLLMYRLKDLGVALSIDDFGTGYSNLHYLQRFPVDKLKLDGSFVREITSDPGSLAIADAIVSVAHRLGMKVVGEMAETESQVAMLAKSGCDYVQGYYFCEPLPADECAELLALGRLPVADIRHMSHNMSRSRVL
ncbi:MAG: EAL domain-containing protein, partial [Herminiimonas sp.]|nr:EAL domain-containing protein [Herminiimonas sp.]